MRLILALLLCLCLPAHAEGFLTRLLHKPVPGGVAVLGLGDAPHAPQVRYQGKPVLVVREEGRRSPSLETALARPNRIPAGSHAAGSSASGAASTRAVRLGSPDRSGIADRRGVSAGWAARHASS